MTERGFGFYEFFAGGGMARLGLGNGWECLFANEYSVKKADSYRANFPPAAELKVEDVWNLRTSDLPSGAILSWASFPCQDLSLAGNGFGLNGKRSGTFLPFWSLMNALMQEGRGVPLIVLENVVGTLTSNRGSDFEAIVQKICASGYRVGALVMDALKFLPQSRARLFIVAVSKSANLPNAFFGGEPSDTWHPARLRSAQAAMSSTFKEDWIWWRLPSPPRRTVTLTDLIESDCQGVQWHTPEETMRLLSLMSNANAEKVRKAQTYGKRIVGTVYKRVRAEESGAKFQRAEVRFDQVSGCLRTPTGGSSRQTILLVEGKQIRSRLLSPREAARLMGLPESYALPSKYNDTYHLAGDGLAVPVVRWLSTHLLHPLALTISPLESKVA